MSRNRRHRVRTRDVKNPIANDKLRFVPLNLSLLSRLRPLAAFVPRQTVLRAYEDRRTWHPDRNRVPVSFSGRTTLTIGERHLAYPSPVVKFHAPERVLVCVRRKRRREVLHARRKAGRGGQRKPRWNNWSSVNC